MSSAPGLTATDWLAAYPPPRSLTLDQEALRIYERAYYIGLRTEGPGDPPITFTTLAAALLVGEDDTSRWFAATAERIGPKKAAVFAEKQITREILDAAAAQLGEPQQPRLSSDKQLLTSSSRAVLEAAENWTQRVGGTDIGVRHLVAAYVLNPPAYHRQQLQQWEVNESAWRTAFFDWVGQRVTWEQWADASQRATPARSVLAFEQTEVKASSLAWPGDADANKILEAAAEGHARRGDAWLGFLTLFFALVETARADDRIREAVLPVWTAAETAGASYQQALAAYYASPGRAMSKVRFDDLDIDPGVLNTLETARELATATLVRRTPADGTVKVGALHLAGALVSRRVDGDDALLGLGLDLPQLRLKLVAHAESRDEYGEIWREMLGLEEASPTGRPVTLNSDEPEAVVRLDTAWKSDPLAIRPDVEAFASLLASKDLEPPLSIGLFGPWGSGKTTFLKRMKRAVQEHAEEAQRSGASPYVPNIVHVEFNAWHFAEDALISSIVDATFREVSKYIKDDQIVAGAAWRDQKLKALESTKRKAKAAEDMLTAASAAVTTAQKDLAAKEQAAAEQATSLRHTVNRVWKLTRSAFEQRPEVRETGVLDAVGDTVKDVDELRRQLDRVRTRPARLIGDLGWARSALFAALVVVLPPLVAWGVSRAAAASQLQQLLTSFTALLGVVGLWAKSATDAVRKVDKVIAEVATAYEQQIASDPAVAAAQTAVATAVASAQTAAVGLQAARDELARAHADAANASLPAQTLQLVSTRIDDMSYKKELTTLSLARADLEALSRILRDQRTDAAGAPTTLRAVDRVILYIDDLDRCQPKDVVRVLQLVHMLLAFELFVVVVAVDSRWVEEALRQSYPWLSGGPNPNDAGDGLVTPEDYLEKIFQIAFWLEPMTAGRAASYLTSLVRTPAPSSADATAAKVSISGVELDYMRALAAYVGPSPRRVKRLVNAYRLIKARLSDAQLDTFVSRPSDDGRARSGPYQIVLGLLVIGTGAQATSTAIMTELGTWDPTATYEDVVRAFRVRHDHDWTVAAQVIETVMRTQRARDVSELRGWARKVGRFLLHGPAAERRAEDLAQVDALEAPNAGT